MHPRFTDAHPRRRPLSQVAHEDVAGAVGVAADQIAGIAVKCHIAAVGADRGLLRNAVALHPRCADAHPRRRPLLQIAQEDVGPVVSIAADQVAGKTEKGYVAAVGADRGLRRTGVALQARFAEAHPRRRALLQVAHKDIGGVVGVAADQVAGKADKRHVAAVGAD